ncbi:MAG: phosphoribosylglycinamide formyltransferase [Desulfobacterales bacterium]|uniref:Phosphoribosylglycinamide formyltransferase n=1 Tax=Candidatus Desulfatibia profunda TaxID=2841695 RepID=A0A8J6NKZ1_9BACT|nr:phosphoribosylglycinamide formyltransferase [Candidatus Desulfatibia profunda]MBL7181182.1 phosphoribosylglycinamide formyltransferase [Desulfobacterales bacterium]
MGTKIRIGALISGSGSNLQAIMDASNTGKINAEIVFVGTDNPAAGGLERVRSSEIPTFVVDYGSIIQRFRKKPDSVALPDDFDLAEILAKQSLFPADSDHKKIKNFLKTRAVAEANLLAAMEPYPFDLLILAGFMRNLTPYFIDRVNTIPGSFRIMNIHPALLPAFPGTDGYGDTFRYGCKVGGCTVHFVDYGEDSGPIIGQKAYEIRQNDTIDSIRAKGLKLEWSLYAECVRLFAEGRLKTMRMTYKLKNGKTYERTVVKILPPAPKG